MWTTFLAPTSLGVLINLERFQAGGACVVPVRLLTFLAGVFNETTMYCWGKRTLWRLHAMVRLPDGTFLKHALMTHLEVWQKVVFDGSLLF